MVDSAELNLAIWQNVYIRWWTTNLSTIYTKYAEHIMLLLTFIVETDDMNYNLNWNTP